MEFLYEYGLFVAKAITLVIAILVVIGGIMIMAAKGRAGKQGKLKVRHLNKRYQAMAMTLQSKILPKQAFKNLVKTRKKQRKLDNKKTEPADKSRSRLFVLNFQGDIQASATASLSEEISALLTVAEPGDEVLVRLESAGGVVHGYGLAASQLARIKARELKLTVAVDKVAASGGYLMACVADRIIAAPFAILGSIGVVSQIPNFHRFLKKNDIDFELITAGEYKRTLTVFGENTDKDRDKFKEDLDDIHDLFKDFVKTHRDSVDLTQVATGEHWFGSRALALNLVDELRTSDDYLLEASQSAELYEISYSGRKNLMQKLGEFTESRIINRLLPPGSGLG